MKTLNREERAVKADVRAEKIDMQQKPPEHRLFIPDARPITPHAGRGAFWYRIWLNMRIARANQSTTGAGSWTFAES